MTVSHPLQTSASLIFVLTLLSPAQSQTVQLKQGVARGSAVVVSGQTVFTFKGLPYAEPPVKERRFLPTGPHKGWQVGDELVQLVILFLVEMSPIAH